MESEYNKCKKIAGIILEQSIPKMDEAYKKFINNTKIIIINHNGLNESRKFSKAAISSINSEKNENKNIRRYLDLLKDIDMKLNQKSRYLNDILRNITSTFAKRKKALSKKVLQNVYDIQNGEIPAAEISNKLKTLGKEIQQTTNEEIPSYGKEVSAFLNKAENDICDDAYKYYNYIITKDKSSLSTMIKTREWTHLPEELFRTSGAFVNTNYES